MALKDSKVFQLFMQTQVAIFNHMEVKGNNLRSKSSICWIDLFFQMLKVNHKFELKNLMVKVSVPMVIVLIKLIIFEILVFKY